LLLKESASTWNYSASAWTQVNNGTADQIQVMLSVAGFVQVEADAMWSNSVSTGANTWTGIGLDSTSASSSTTTIGSGTSVSGITGVDIAQYNGAPGIGPHYFSWLIWGAGANTQTWYGTNAIPDRIQTGLTGMMLN
jgi:hypothetical protein